MSNGTMRAREFWLACDGFDRFYTAYGAREHAKQNREMEPIHVREVFPIDKTPEQVIQAVCDLLRSEKAFQDLPNGRMAFGTIGDISAGFIEVNKHLILNSEVKK